MWGRYWHKPGLGATPAGDLAIPACADHAIAYDSVRGVVVLFGGQGESNVLIGTWEYGVFTQPVAAGFSPGPGRQSPPLRGLRPLVSLRGLRGNLLAQGTNVYTWDAADRLVSANIDGVVSSFEYDGSGNRTARWWVG